MAVIYQVKEIRGDYAILVTDDGIENPVAMFFLPDETDVGKTLKYENFEYSVI